MKRINAKLFTLLLAASATQSIGMPAIAWSPLQADSMKEIESVPKESLRDKFFQNLIQQQQAAEQAAIEKMMRSGEAAGATKSVPTPELDDKSTAESESEITPAQAATPEPATEKQSLDASNDCPASPTLDSKPAIQSAGILAKEKVLDPGYFIKKSQGFVKEQDYQSALNYVNRALELNPQCWEAWYQKALTYQLAGYDAAAARRYIKLLERKPDMLEAHVSLGSLYRKHQNLELAAKEYKSAIELNYYSFPAHYNLANVLMDQKNLEQALKEYKVCLKLQPQNAMVHNNLGVIYQHRNYFDEAAQEFRSASHLDPSNSTFATNLANARKRLGNSHNKAVQM